MLPGSNLALVCDGSMLVLVWAAEKLELQSLLSLSNVPDPSMILVLQLLSCTVAYFP